MSDETNASDVILEGAAEVVEGVSDIARGFSGIALSSAFVVGAGLGGAAGYFFCKRQLQTKYTELAQEESQRAQEEIAAMREHYNEKFVALNAVAQKSGIEDLAEIVRDRGYSPADDDADRVVEDEPGNPPSVSPPMAVTPPAAVVQAAQGPAPEPEPEPEPVTRNIFEEAEHHDEWNWDREKAIRTPLAPYVIHIDERHEFDSYDHVTYTYYEEDDVLCNERDEIFDREDRERLVGEKNLEKFGHGSGDPAIVYVRNDALAMVLEVIRSPNSYSEEVAGFTPDPPELRHADRRFDDER